MKPSPQANYPINVYPYTVENGGSEHYAGIYGIQLNNWFSVSLSPAYDFATYDFPADSARFIALNPDAVQTTDGARVETVIAGAPLVLLEKEDQAGQLVEIVYERGRDPELPPLDTPELGRHYIYCLTKAEYIQYAAELEAIMNREFDGSEPDEQPRQYNKLDNLRRYEVIARIHALLAAHPEILTKYQRELVAL
ncbi:hypothetical protein [Hymenobacter terrenus]|uniref:hypothetical protein n=1 Tax=Hymenobacter terrenus TaxID=1629124 RepID=UPI000619AB0F|nr:hypothetical protein [Hymenobacter terrenus]